MYILQNNFYEINVQQRKIEPTVRKVVSLPNCIIIFLLVTCCFSFLFFIVCFGRMWESFHTNYYLSFFLFFFATFRQNAIHRIDERVSFLILHPCSFALSQAIALYEHFIQIKYMQSHTQAKRKKKYYAMDRGIVIFDVSHLRKHAVCECCSIFLRFSFRFLIFALYAIHFCTPHTKYNPTLAMDRFWLHSSN